MNYKIGIDKPIYPEWMEYSASLFLEGLSFEEAREKLEQYLINRQVKSQVVRRKSKSILLNVWFKPQDVLNLEQIKDKLKIMNQKEKMELYCQLLRKQYPFFDDVCKIISRLEKVSETVVTADVSRRIYEIWGETPGIKATLAKALRTYRLFQEAIKS